MSNETDAQEKLNLELDGADHTDDSGFEEGFDQSAGLTKEKEDNAELDQEEKPDSKPESEVPEAPAEKEDEPAKELTLDEKLEAAAKAMDAPQEKPDKQEKPESVDILDRVAPEYAWAKEARESGKLAEFIKTQPKAVQKAAMSDDPDDAMYVLDLFKKSQEPAAPTKAEVKSVLSEFGDVKVRKADGGETTLKDLAAEYGNEEMMEAFAAMTQAMLGKSKPAVEKNNDAAELRQEIAQMKADALFWESVTEAHPDAKKIVKSGELKKWVEEQKKDSLTRLFKSPDPDHGILVLDAFKEAKAKAAKSGDAAKKHKQTVDLHSESLRPKRETKMPGKPKEEDPEGFDEGFDAALKD